MYRKFLLFVFILTGTAGNIFAGAFGDMMSTPWIGDKFILYFMYFVIFILLLFVLLLFRISMHLARFRQMQEGKDAEEVKPSRIWERFFQVRSVKTDKDVMLDHDYDGIKELDNPAPPWFMYLFYLTIIFAVVYYIRFEITGSGPTQHEEYLAELDAAEQKRMAGDESGSTEEAMNITEDNVELATGEAELKAGKTIFTQYCQVCHGVGGKGLSGPNLTDDYWMHGGGIKNVYKTIKYGVPDKGMAPWENTLSPKQMRDVASYILNLDKVSEAEGGLPPYGELYVPEENNEQASAADTTSAPPTEPGTEGG